MDFLEKLETGLVENWYVWLVSLTLVIAAVIDGIKLKVPNWITFPMIIAGWIFSCAYFAFNGEPWYDGLGLSLLGTAVGFGLLLPVYAIGGMGAGDVKLLMGVGAWMHSTTTFYAFCLSVLVGGVIAVAMVLYKKGWKKHYTQFRMILQEILTVRDPEQLAEMAAERKSSMLLLPYGIPIAIGSVVYFAWMGMLI
ncbi:MAG: prepilin peptidase [Planctomycetes bacterium]|nr:prepilin peptidase [Planctomycetota bacterium]